MCLCSAGGVSKHSFTSPWNPLFSEEGKEGILLLPVGLGAGDEQRRLIDTESRQQSGGAVDGSDLSVICLPPTGIPLIGFS